MFLIRAFNKISAVCVSGLLKKNDPMISFGLLLFFIGSIPFGIYMIYNIANGGGQVESIFGMILAFAAWCFILTFILQVLVRAGYEIWKDFYEGEDFPKD